MRIFANIHGGNIGVLGVSADKGIISAEGLFFWGNLGYTCEEKHKDAVIF